MHRVEFNVGIKVTDNTDMAKVAVEVGRFVEGLIANGKAEHVLVNQKTFPWPPKIDRERFPFEKMKETIDG
jgi:hypothetical protein